MRMLLKSVSAALILGASASAASAEGSWSANVSLVSDYTFRGVTQTDGAPTIQGGFDYEGSGFYVGTWASGVDFGDGTSTEIDIYGGFTPSYNGIDFDFGAIAYLYPDAPDDPAQNFVEVYAGASTTLGDTLEVGASVAYSPDFYLETGGAFYTSVSAGLPLGESPFSLSASLGYQSFTDDDDCSDCDYGDYSIGVSTSYEGFDFGLSFVDTFDLDGNDEAVVFSIGRSM